jgi:hypothetical protein
MTRIFIGAAAALLLSAAAASAQSPALAYPPPPEQALCTDWTAKLSRGIEVIGAPASAIEKARASLAAAQQKQQSGQWYGCSTAAEAGLKALNAG